MRKKLLLPFTHWRKAQRVLLLLLCTAFTLPSIAETLTVYNGTTTNDYVPIYGLYVDDYLKCEFIIPASELAEMKDGTITGLTWYLSRTASASWGNANFQVFIKEVDFTSFSSTAFSGTTGATTVYQGPIDGTQSTMNITFSTPYVYNGGNLLVGVYNTVKGTYKSSSFYGQTVNNASISANNGSSLNNITSGTRRNFAPKTTFTYEPPTAYAKPTNLAVSDITHNSAKATWDGVTDAQGYNLRYRPFNVTIWDFDDSSMGEWSTIDADGDGYNWVIGSACGGIYLAEGGSLAGEGHNNSQDLVTSGSYSNVSGVGKLYPDNYLVSPKLTLGGKFTFWAKGQDSSYPSEVFGVAVSTTGNTNPSDFTMVGVDKTATSDWVLYTFDMSQFAGQEGYIAIRHYNCSDQFMLDIDDIKYSLPGNWETKENVASPYTIEGLDPSTEYEVQVQAVYADGTSDWTSSVNFTTLSADAMPTNLTVTDVTDCTATANWNGVQDSYNLRYRTAAKAEVNFFEGFENGLDAWTLVNTDGDNYNWQVVDPQTAFSNDVLPRYEGSHCVMSRSYVGSALTPDQWLISPEIDDLGGMLRYYVFDDGADYPETYRIYISTSGTSISDFVPVTDDLLTPNSAAWTEQSIDLSSYAGQSGHIAFRHYNCTDQDFMFIDAIGIYANEVPAGEWVTINDVTSPYVIKGLEPKTDYEVQVQGIYDGGTTDWTESEYFTTLEAVSRPMTLAVLVADGEVGIRYTISEPLLVVRSNGNSIWLKDANGSSILKTSPAEGYQNYAIVWEGNPHENQADYDQSNWIEVQLADGSEDVVNLVGNRIKADKITGTFSNKTNPTMTGVTLVVDDDDITFGEDEYMLNYYCTANFDGSQPATIGTGAGTNYFFMNPKPQECAFIIWAKYDAANGKMIMPSTSEGNGHGFHGEFEVDLSLNIGTSPEDGKTYNFEAIVRMIEPTGGNMLRDNNSNGYIVYPLNLSEPVVTGINDVTGKAVAGVKYYNVAGIESDRPFEGVNIIVTTYTDGSRSSAKVLK